ncbi:MAG: DnaJ domain-containing protein [Desulforhabdus sp.]|jgi:molecular chaperone DnaJ|nr:DnaJ domain-containing protein [Desulforhabdus sp.]
MSCHYKTLGVSTKASQEEIKKAFRLLALRCHPDRNPEDPNAGKHFVEALEAYETLTDPVKRRKYDKLSGYSNPGNGARRRNYAGSRGSQSSIQNAVEEAFGIKFEGVKERVINDIRFDLQIPRSVLSEGTYESIDYSRLVFCCECMGKGRKSARSSCSKCNGQGELEESCSLRIWIPAGSEQGSRLRVSGAGDQPVPWSRAGDLVVLLHVADGA